MVSVTVRSESIQILQIEICVPHASRLLARKLLNVLNYASERLGRLNGALCTREETIRASVHISKRGENDKRGHTGFVYV